MSDVATLSEVTLIARDGSEHLIAPEPNLTLMEAIREAGFDELLALCGGACSCATCHVYIDARAPSVMRPATQDEDDLLEGSNHRRTNSRLSCQVRAGDVAGERVKIAPDE